MVGYEELGVEEWLVGVVKALYKNSRSCVIVNKLGRTLM